MTDADLKAMEELAEKAGFSVWKTGDGTMETIRFTKREVWAPLITADGNVAAGTKICDCHQANAEEVADFIAASRTFVPDAIAEIRRLTKLVEAAYLEGWDDYENNAIGRSGIVKNWDKSNSKRAIEGSETK